MKIRGNSRSSAGSRLCIAFFGPDGAGKSAVIEQLQGQLGPQFSGLTRFHFRPAFRSQGMNRPAVLDPHSLAPRGTLTSYCKLVYWLIDCWYGYLATARLGAKGAQLVIFDRYFQDILVDPVRYRLPASSLWLARFMVRLAPRPDLCILLDVPAEVLQGRKCEVSPAESHRQRVAYLEMFRSLPNHLLVDASRPLDEVTSQIATAIFRYFVPSLTQQPEAYPIANL